MITAQIETGSIRLSVFGENAFILRKGKKIKILSGEKETKLIENDTLGCGSNTIVQLDISYNKGMEAPVDDWKSRTSKTFWIMPDSELALSGFKEWDKTEKNGKRIIGKMVKKIELKKGLFSVSYSNTDDAMDTPVALVKFIGNCSGLFDVFEDKVYSNATKSSSTNSIGVEFENKLTKQKVIAKTSIPAEIIVTKDAIYKRGMTQIDEIFSPMNAIAINSFFQNKLSSNIPNLDSKAMAEQYKNMPNTMEQMLGGIEMFKQMSPADLEKMMKMGEAHGGGKVTPEMLKQMKEGQQAFMAMEKEGKFEEMKKAMAKSKGLMEGMGNQGIEHFAKAQAEGMGNLKKASEQTSQMFMVDGKKTGIESFLENPRKYKPLTKEAGAVKVL